MALFELTQSIAGGGNEASRQTFKNFVDMKIVNNVEEMYKDLEKKEPRLDLVPNHPAALFADTDFINWEKLLPYYIDFYNAKFSAGLTPSAAVTPFVSFTKN